MIVGVVLTGKPPEIVVGAGLNTIDIGNLFLSPSIHLNEMVPASVTVDFPRFLPKKDSFPSICSPSSAEEAYPPRLPFLARLPENLPMLLITSAALLNLCRGIRASCTTQVIRSEQHIIIPTPPIQRRDFKMTAWGVVLLMRRFTNPVDSRRISVIVSDAWRIDASTSMRACCKRGRHDKVSRKLRSNPIVCVFISI